MSGDDPFAHEPSVAIDLSRRKGVVRHTIVGAQQAAAPYVTMARIALARLARDRLAKTGGIVLAVLTLLGVFADLLASDLPIVCRFHGDLHVLPNVIRPRSLAQLDCARMRQQSAPGDWMIAPLVAFGPGQPGETADVLAPPLSRGHPLGADALGRDVFARVVHGSRTALSIGLAASLVLVAIGVALGAIAGFAGGVVDAFVARMVESLTAIPTLVLVLVVGALVPYSSTATLLCTIALTRWTDVARLVRSEVLLALGANYVMAARALGASPRRVLWRHVLPNAVGPAIVGAAFASAWVVLIEATVDFLGVGSSEGWASWGEVMGEARAHMHAWWLVAFPGAALLATLLSLNLVGEAARNALDPRLRGDEWSV
jgi:peptide/nickel transport system permease protein